MHPLHLPIQANTNLYLKNPDSTKLGKAIISKSIYLIDKIGFESFTFKKLSAAINSTESSVYRYFQSKHALLIYLTSWYWMWIDYKIVLSTINISSSETKLINAISILTHPTDATPASQLNIELLDNIIITESLKAYHTKDVDLENEKGFFQNYKDVVNRIANIVLEINPQFEFPHMLISTIIEGAHQQRFFSDHLPNLTDIKNSKDSIFEFYSQMALKMIA